MPRLGVAAWTVAIRRGRQNAVLTGERPERPVAARTAIARTGIDESACREHGPPHPRPTRVPHIRNDVFLDLHNSEDTAAARRRGGRAPGVNPRARATPEMRPGFRPRWLPACRRGRTHVRAERSSRRLRRGVACHSSVGARPRWLALRPASSDWRR